MSSLSTPIATISPNGAAPSNTPQSVGAEEKPDAVSDFAAMLAASWFSLTPTELPPSATAQAGAAEAAVGTVAPSPVGDQLLPSGVSAEQLPVLPEALSAEALLALNLKTGPAAETGAAPVHAGGAAETMPAADFAAAWSATNQNLQSEAAQRDSLSVAAMLAQNSRPAQPLVLSSALKPVLAAVADARGADKDAQLAGVETVLAANAAPVDARLFAALRDDVVAGQTEPSRGVVDQIAGPALELFEKLSPREAGTLRLRLNPEELGRVDVQITRDAAGRLSAQLTAEHEAARRALNEGINNLRETLERAGVAVERLDVAVDVQTNTQQFAGEQRDLPEAPRAASAGAVTTVAAPAAPASKALAVDEDRLVSIRA